MLVLSIITVVIPVGPPKPAVSTIAPTPVAVKAAAAPTKSGKHIFLSVLWGVLVLFGALPQSKIDSPAIFLFH